MEFAILEKGSNHIKLEITEPEQTLLQPIVVELLSDKNVERAQLLTRHPVLDKPVLVVEVKSGNPETAIKKAAKHLSEQFSECLELLEKEL